MRMDMPWTAAGLVVFLFCFLTATATALLLFHSFRRNRERLLFWTGLCFALQALNSAETFIDYILPPSIDLLFLRNMTTVAAIGALLFGFVWESE